MILGTGLTECILSGLLSVDGKKVLHLDRNDYYGAESASLSLSQARRSGARSVLTAQLFKKFRQGQEAPKDYGRDRDCALAPHAGADRAGSVDLIPKFMMANGELTKMLVHTDVTRYMEFKQVAGSYVHRDGRVA